MTQSLRRRRRQTRLVEHQSPPPAIPVLSLLASRRRSYCTYEMIPAAIAFERPGTGHGCHTASCIHVRRCGQQIVESQKTGPWAVQLNCGAIQANAPISVFPQNNTSIKQGPNTQPAAKTREMEVHSWVWTR